MHGYTRDELLALTPSRYLADGYYDASGQWRGELASDYATAAATQLFVAELPAQELAFTFQALRLILPQHEGPPRDRANAALDEALETVTRMTRQTNNEGLVLWLRDCVTNIRKPEDIDALLRHMQAVLRLYTVIAAIPEPPDASPDGASRDGASPDGASSDGSSPDGASP
jgi:hypothetical protein